MSWIDWRNDKNMDISFLKIDEAVLWKEEGMADLNLFARHKECLKCPHEFVKERIKNQYVVNLNYEYFFTKNDSKPLLLKDNTYLCSYDSFQEFGEYKYEGVDKNKECILKIMNDPITQLYLPILTVFLIICGLGFLIQGIVWGIGKLGNKKNLEKPPKKERVRSLDTFRGIAIVLMIFVNYGGGGYEFLEHAVWNGLHPADFVFPWFLWIMGVCIPISIDSKIKRNESNGQIVIDALKRSIKLFCLGIFLNSPLYLKEVRFFGVLQRFGICYFVVTLLYLFLGCKKPSQTVKGFRKYFVPFIRISRGWIVVAIICAIHTLIIFFVAEDGCPRGYMGPGGRHENEKYFNCVGGATGFIDRKILGTHAYSKPTCNEIFKGTVAFDPEGVLGCLTSIVHAYIGLQAGMILKYLKGHEDRLISWISWAILCGVLGGALCGFSKDDGFIPLNKNLWSISFVLVTCASAFFLLSFCYIIIDWFKVWSGKPFLFAGMNAILMYIGHEITFGNFPVHWALGDSVNGSEMDTHFKLLLENAWGASFWVLVSYYLYKINYFFVL